MNWWNKETKIIRIRDWLSFKRLLAGGLLLALAAAGIYWRQSLWAAIIDQERLRSWIASYGPWAPLAAVALVTLKVLIAPIPGQIVGTVNGYLFGTWGGTLYSMIGVTLGTLLAMGLGRVFGRPLVVRLVPAARLDRLDGLARRRGPVFFFLIYLLPFTPDDVISYLAGLTPLPLVPVLVLGTLARVPGMVVGNWFGANVPNFTPWEWMLIGAFILGWIGLILRYYNHLEAATLRFIARLDGTWAALAARLRSTCQ